MIKTILGMCVGTALAFGQAQPKQSLLVTQVSNITLGYIYECGGVQDCLDNRSVYLRNNNYHAIEATGQGTWQVQIQTASGSPSGFVSCGSAATITNASAPAIGYCYGYYDFLLISITGANASTVTVNYSGQNQLYLSSVAGSVSFPISVANGGTGGTNILSAKSSLDIIPPVSSDYIFLPQAPGGTLTAHGANQPITMLPCPIGINGSDIGHNIYLSGGTGNAEATPITGGTCTSGSPSGTITVTPNNAHSGAWSVSSATAGIQEALVANGGGEVRLPAGQVTPNGTITPPAGSVITCTNSAMSTDSGAATTINFEPNNIPLFNVFADVVVVQGCQMIHTGAPAVAGSVGVNVVNDGVTKNSKASQLNNLAISGFYNGVLVDSTIFCVQENVTVSGSVGDGFVWNGAQGRVHLVESDINGGNGYTISAGTYSSGGGGTPGITALGAFGNQGWCVYNTQGIVGMDWFCNNDGQGEIYVNGPSTDSFSLTHVIVQFAGQLPSGSPFTFSSTAPGIYVAATSGPVRFYDVELFDSNGNGLDLRANGTYIIGAELLGAGGTSTTGNIYCLNISGSDLHVSHVTCDGFAKIQGQDSIITDNTFVAASSTTPTVYTTSGTRLTICDNKIFGGGAANAWTVDAGTTFASICTNNLQGTVSNGGSLAQSFWTVTPPGLFPFYTASGGGQPNYHGYQNSCTIGTNCSITLSGAAAFTSAFTYNCSVTNTSNPTAPKMLPVSGTAFTITGTNGDNIIYTCTGY